MFFLENFQTIPRHWVIPSVQNTSVLHTFGKMASSGFWTFWPLVNHSFTRGVLSACCMLSAKHTVMSKTDMLAALESWKPVRQRSDHINAQSPTLLFHPACPGIISAPQDHRSAQITPLRQESLSLSFARWYKTGNQQRKHKGTEPTGMSEITLVCSMKGKLRHLPKSTVMAYSIL